MKYLTITPNYTGSCLKDDYDGEVKLEDLNLPLEFLYEIKSWHSSYRRIIPLSTEQRKLYTKAIEELDIEGLKIAEKLKSFLKEDVKIRYFSEGKLRFLN